MPCSIKSVMQPSSNGGKNGKTLSVAFKKQMIDRCTNRDTVVSTMMFIAKQRIGPEEFLALSEADGRCSAAKFMALTNLREYEKYNRRMEVELEMSNCVNINALLNSKGKMMTGKFFLCRTITPSSKIRGVDTAVDDPEGKKAIRLTLCNYSLSSEMGVTNFETVLPAGTIMIIKNPHFKMVDDKSVVCGLICDNPSDVMLLSPKKMKELFPQVEFKCNIALEVREWIGALFWENLLGETNTQCAIKLKNLANKMFIQKQWTDAIRFYDLALDYLSTDEDAVAVDVLSNKAAALVSMGCFNQALLCCDRVLAVDSSHLKAIYRRTKALIGLGRYKEAGEFLDDKLNKYPSLAEREDILMMRSNISILCLPPGNEAVSAVFKHKIKDDMLEECPPLSTADITPDFKGHIELLACDKGQGLFATQDIQPEELLIICRPFAGSYIKPSEAEKFKTRTTHHEELVGMMANKIAFDPQLGRELYKLWAGPDLKCVDDNDASITKVDMKRINEIAKFNYTGYSDEYISGGIWLASSKINNSCSDANVVYDHHPSGLVMVVTAFKPVKKGQEILKSYVDPERPLKERDFLKTHAFICNCRLCQLDRSESKRVHNQRKLLLDSLNYDRENDLYQYYPCIFSKDLETISKLVNLRKNTPDLNVVLVDEGIHTIAAVVLFDKRRYEECIDILQKMFLVAENLPPTCFTFKIAVGILRCYLTLQMKKEICKWTEEVRKWYRLYYGDLESIRKEYPTLPEDLAKVGIDFFSR